MQAKEPTRQRIHSIDILRGIIMIIMALDHVRDFYTDVSYDPLDLTKTTTALFLTRWITHFCAPIFIFLSGISAWLSLSRKESKAAASIFLLKRGLWLILLEITIIRFGWSFDPAFQFVFLQVIWAIGWSMMCLAGLIHLNKQLIAGFSLLLIFGHNALDGLHAKHFGGLDWLWMMLHDQGKILIGDYMQVAFFYPIIPWIGVMSLGYVFGSLYQLESARRKALFVKIGIAAFALFLVLRVGNIYGDPEPWETQRSIGRTILAIIKVHKYPPSLSYLLITLGTAIILLGLWDASKAERRIARFVMVYGKVPFFYYIMHLYLIHASQLLIAAILGIDLSGTLPGAGGAAWGFGLPVVYAVWAGIVLMLYYPCRWFVGVKQQHKKWWLSYL